jgi:hypothetical protein
MARAAAEIARMRAISALAALFLLAPEGCGYQAAYADGAGGRLHVKVVRSLVADAVAADEVAAGVRDELARGGWLEAGERYPRVEIEVLRADEASEGVTATGGVPVARATDVGVVARAWMVRAAGADPEHDTGDVRAEDTVAVDEAASPAGFVRDPTADSLHHTDAVRAAARRLGRMLAARLLGAPGASEEGVSAPSRGVVRSDSPQVSPP